MKKNHQPIKLQNTRSKKELSLRRKKKKGKKIFSGSIKFIHLTNFYRKYDLKILENSKSKLISFFESKFKNKWDFNLHFKIPKIFSLKRNYKETLEIIISINYTIFESRGFDYKITVDFSNCIDVDLPSLFLLQICKIQLKEDLEKINKRLTVIKFIPKIEVSKSNHDEVNKQLLLNGFVKIDELTLEKGDLVPIHSIGFLTGRKQQKSYAENKKGKLTTKTVLYINDCLNDVGFELSEEGRGFVEGIISEMLNNAEDHSPFENWYLTANYLKNLTEDLNEEKIGELNLAIFNFGFSIFEGLEQTKELNIENYNLIESLYNSYLGRNYISKDNYFTLLALQEGISRLKYEDSSRGTGTIKFIKSFLELGDFENEKHKPRLHIFSGKTELICDNKYRPFEKDGVNLISLNSIKDLKEKQDRNNLKELDLEFPGTLLNAKIYLNQNYLERKQNEGK
ncbi:hypothetical protein MMU07_12530 [Aquiflexum sp. LQ15W]|uniref:hypothetical protein n=1 Tax=Cognataquiflexum nitidum TaxID=2922272 RepID=UPI001F141246|nr:hypothetical protein [Cognataquiflexum nitidum]MCH6200408.1 hypothetical protein [Cognataquiflexum nitidum]